MAGRIASGWWGEFGGSDSGSEPEGGSDADSAGSDSGSEAEAEYTGPGGVENVKSSLDTIDIETEAFSGEALALYSLPGSRVMEAMLIPDQLKIIKLVELFKLALVEPRLAEQVEILSWGELIEAVMQWAQKSEEGQGRTPPPSSGRGRGRGGRNFF